MNTYQNGYNGPRPQGRFGSFGMGPAAKSDAPCPCQERPSRACMEDPLEDMALAMAYVPWQEWGSLYDMEKALNIGTVFKDLDKPFLGRRCGR